MFFTDQAVHEYLLYCPRCDQALQGAWFTECDGTPDIHGYFCCSGCVSWFVRNSKVPLRLWDKLHTKDDYCRYPRNSWVESYGRSQRLVQDKEADRLRNKQRKRKRRKRKRDLQSEGSAAAGAAGKRLSADKDLWEECVPMLLDSIRAKVVAAAIACGVDDPTAKRICETLDLTVEGLPNHLCK